MTNFQFINTLVTVVRVLLLIRGLSKKIEGHNLDDVSGQVKEARDNWEFERIDAEGDFFKRCCEYACSVSNLVNVESVMPRIAVTQSYREHADANTTTDYYR